jgi:predicted AlkP superfamily pyrophosphatase or phosphodiesterase
MSQQSTPPTLILFVDAFSFDYLAERPFMPGFWQAELPLETLIGYSSSIVPALWSGLMPDQMNAWNEFFFRPRAPYRLPRLLDLAPHAYARAFLRRLLFRYATRVGWYRQSLPGIPSSVEHLFSHGDVRYWEFPPVPVGEAGLDARFRAANIPYRFWFNSYNFRADEALANLARAAGEAQVYIYGTADIDGAGHVYGPHPHSFSKRFDEIERFIGGACQVLGRHGPPSVVVVSDHGMTEVTKRVDLVDALKPWKLGEDYLMFLDSTMARFWDVGTVSLPQIEERLATMGIGRFLNQYDRDRQGLNFADNRYGDEIFLADPGVLFTPSFIEVPYLPGTVRVKGMHGYAPEERSTRGVFLYRGEYPLEQAPTRVTDIADLIAQMHNLLRPVLMP